MEQRSIGSLQVSLVGLGCNNFGGRIERDRVQEVVDAAIEAGITLFDTADIYGGTKSEELLGEALGSRREQVVVATKFGAPLGDGRGGATPAYVKEACEASLRRLGTDHIDLYQLHVPDKGTPIEDTLAALHDLVVDGKVREIGCSNFGRSLMDASADASAASGGAAFVSVQNQLSLLERAGEAELVEGALAHGLGILPFFPLASGMLTGKYARGQAPAEGTRLSHYPEDRRASVMSDAHFDKVDRLQALAEDRGHTLLELAFSWLAGLPAMASIIAGATSAGQVHANASAVGWHLTDDDRAAVDAITLVAPPDSLSPEA
jgi:aryl-alcohol dehydrogenase-like predicted oxidoreductase